MYSPILAILFGLIGTVILHISKAMQRQGIEIIDQIRAKNKEPENGNTRRFQKTDHLHNWFDIE